MSNPNQQPVDRNLRESLLRLAGVEKRYWKASGQIPSPSTLKIPQPFLEEKFILIKKERQTAWLEDMLKGRIIPIEDAEISPDLGSPRPLTTISRTILCGARTDAVPNLVASQIVSNFIDRSFRRSTQHRQSSKMIEFVNQEEEETTQAELVHTRTAKVHMINSSKLRDFRPGTFDFVAIHNIGPSTNSFRYHDICDFVSMCPETPIALVTGGISVSDFIDKTAIHPDMAILFNEGTFHV